MQREKGSCLLTWKAEDMIESRNDHPAAIEIMDSDQGYQWRSRPKVEKFEEQPHT